MGALKCDFLAGYGVSGHVQPHGDDYITFVNGLTPVRAVIGGTSNIEFADALIPTGISPSSWGADQAVVVGRRKERPMRAPWSLSTLHIPFLVGRWLAAGTDFSSLKKEMYYGNEEEDLLALGGAAEPEWGAASRRCGLPSGGLSAAGRGQFVDVRA